VQEGVDAATKELLFYWLTPEKTCAETGLAFWGSKREASLCLAVESGHYDEVFARLAVGRGVTVEELVRRVSRGEWPREDAEVWKVVEHDLAVRESGHDTTERLVDSAADLVTADLNSLIVKTAKDLYQLTGQTLFKELAEKLEKAMIEYMYDEDLGYFCDWDVVMKTRKRFLSPAGVVYPLWAGIGDEHIKKRLRDSLVIYLEARGGVVGSERLNYHGEGSVDSTEVGNGGRQWDWPFGWAPHQILAWEGLSGAGFEEDARRLSFRWLATLTKVYEKYGCVPEKMDVVTKLDPMNAGEKVEYGTQCAGKNEFFGWTAASVVLGNKYLSDHERLVLNEISAESCVEEQLLFLRNILKHHPSRPSDLSSTTWSTVASYSHNE
jgi:alpha,alpha-trehalase